MACLLIFYIKLFLLATTGLIPDAQQEKLSVHGLKQYETSYKV